PNFPVSGTTDIWFHERSAEVKHQLSLLVPAGVARSGAPQALSVRFRAPAAIKDLTVVSGGKLILHDPGKEVAWILPDAEPFTQAELVLRYDFSLPEKRGQTGEASTRTVQVPFVWPEGATREN